MAKPDYDRRRVHSDPGEYFLHERPSSMKFTADAAMALCQECSTRGILILGIEGGIKRSDGKFEARLDCMWQTDLDPSSADLNATYASNSYAKDFIQSRVDVGVDNAFMVTSRPIAR